MLRFSTWLDRTATLGFNNTTRLYLYRGSWLLPMLLYLLTSPELGRGYRESLDLLATSPPSQREMNCRGPWSLGHALPRMSEDRSILLLPERCHMQGVTSQRNPSKRHSLHSTSSSFSPRHSSFQPPYCSSVIFWEGTLDNLHHEGLRDFSRPWSRCHSHGLFSRAQQRHRLQMLPR